MDAKTDPKQEVAQLADFFNLYDQMTAEDKELTDTFIRCLGNVSKAPEEARNGIIAAVLKEITAESKKEKPNHEFLKQLVYTLQNELEVASNE